MKLKIDELNRVTLCCGKGGCPVLSKDVKMQEEEAKLINDALEQLKDK